MAKKCNAIKGKWCGAIDQVADFGNPDAVGIAVSRVMNVKTRKEGNGIRVGFARSRYKELGGKFIWLNFCPFCGSDVSKRTL